MKKKKKKKKHERLEAKQSHLEKRLVSMVTMNFAFSFFFFIIILHYFFCKRLDIILLIGIGNMSCWIVFLNQTFLHTSSHLVPFRFL